MNRVDYPTFLSGWHVGNYANTSTADVFRHMLINEVSRDMRAKFPTCLDYGFISPLWVGYCRKRRRLRRLRPVAPQDEAAGRTGARTPALAGWRRPHYGWNRD